MDHLKDPVRVTPTTPLSDEAHHELKVDTRALPAFGDHANRALLVGSEIAEAHKDYPILLHRQPDTGELATHAILGFDRDENLFVDGEAWDAAHVPAAIARGPFSIGYAPDRGDGGARELHVMIEEAHPRCGASGEALFLRHGGETPYLQRIRRVLQAIDAGLQIDRVFHAQLTRYDLLEEVRIEVTLDAERRYGFADYLTIDRERLAALPAEDLAEMNRRGTLMLAFCLVSSLSNFQRLLQRRIRREQRVAAARA